jgi:hypothetical protein
MVVVCVDLLLMFIKFLVREHATLPVCEAQKACEWDELSADALIRIQKVHTRAI